MKITTAIKSKLIQPTGFGAYDVCINPYVGCQFGCKYCYVRFFVKDKEEEWGDFVRLRTFIETKLPKEINGLNGQRLVIGTMTDPYQPQERTARLTRKILEIIKLNKNPCKEIGIFTRSPIVKDDIDLLKELKVRVHLTVTPFEPDILKKIEPIPVSTAARFAVLKELVDNGISCHVSISPILPILSDGFIDEFVEQIASIKPRGFTVDPMQCYGPALKATDESLGDNILWLECRSIVTDGDKYAHWKEENKKAWQEAWSKHVNLGLCAMIMDHQEKVRYNLNTGEPVDFHGFSYG